MSFLAMLLLYKIDRDVTLLFNAKKNCKIKKCGHQNGLKKGHGNKNKEISGISHFYTF